MATSSQEFLGRYEMVSRLGRGGMAETWRARLLGAEGVTKPVLIKRVLSEYANDQAFISMFISEARISATLSHGNIAQVFDFGRVDGEYFLAMEFVDGQPLDRVIKRALRSGLPGIPVPLATFIALEMCRGLHYAHTRKDDKGVPLGIVHRDISPDNVLVSYEGQVKIVDFGIAKARELRGFHTEPGVVKGKYLFFSPEQARGEEVGARSDVWATGIVLYEMLCGQLPVKGPQYAAQLKLIEGKFPRPRELRPELPEELEDIVMRALTVEVNRRFPSANAFGDALAGFLYSAAPRFSAMSVAHLVQELFREDLSSQGREVQVPPSFLEELSLWRTSDKTPTRPAAGPSSRPRPPSQPALPEVALGEEVPTETQAILPPPRWRPSRRQLGMAAGGGALLVLLGAGVWSLSHRHSFESPALPAQAHPKAISSPTDDTDGPAPSAAAEPPTEPTLEGTHAFVTYPVSTVRLVARRDLIPLPTGRFPVQALTRDTVYTLSEPLAVRDSPPVMFWIRGEGVSANDAMGRIPPKPIQVQGGTSMLFLRLASAHGDLTQPVDRQTHMLLVQSAEEHMNLHLPVPPTAVASLEHAFEIRGLRPEAVYELRLGSVGAGAFLLGEAGPANRKVACALRLGADVAASGTGEFEREQQFLLQEGKPYPLKGARAVLCGFLDDDPSDNGGEMELRIARRSGPEGASPEAGPPEVPSVPGPLAAGSAAGTPREAGPTGSPDSLLERARALFKQSQYKEAETVLKTCVNLAPTHARCYLMLGAAHAKLGRMEEGAQDYQRFLELAPPRDPAVPQVKSLLKSYERSKKKEPLKDDPYH